MRKIYPFLFLIIFLQLGDVYAARHEASNGSNNIRKTKNYDGETYGIQTHVYTSDPYVEEVKVYKQFSDIGSIDPSFGINGYTEPVFMNYYNYAVQNDGKIVVVGIIRYAQRLKDRFRIARYNPDGSFDKTFGDSGVLTIEPFSDPNLGNGWYALIDSLVNKGTEVILYGHYNVPRLGYPIPEVYTISSSEPPVSSTCGSGSILREYWANVSGMRLSDIPVNIAPTATLQLTSFEVPANVADNYGQRIRGYLCPPVTGDYTFYIAGDDESGLWLSTSDNPADKRKIAYVGGGFWTQAKEWTKFETQKSVTIRLQANTRYYIEALNKEGAGGDNVAVGWIIPGYSGISIIPGSVLSPYTGTDYPPITSACGTGNILREYWGDVSGMQLSDIPVNTAPTSTSQLTSFEAPTNVADNYGQRIRGYLCPPVTGDYIFYIAGDDESALWISTSDNPADKRKIAYIGGGFWTDPKEWTKFETQKSITISLQANRRYYIEALNKEGAGADNLAVGWLIPGYSEISVIPGLVLSPFNDATGDLTATTANKEIVNSSSNYNRKVADEVYNRKLSLKALSNPTSTHFTINITTNKSEPVDLIVLDGVGRVIETQRKVSPNGSLKIGDRYQLGVYYLQALQGGERVTLKLIKGTFN